MAQGTDFPLRKPPGFHYDFFLLGITTFIAGLLGVPAPNGLIPQAPIHTTSLLVMGRSPKDDIETPPAISMSEKRDASAQVRVHHSSEDGHNISRTRSRIHSPRDSGLEPDPTRTHEGMGDARRHEVPVGVVEQRVSNLAQGALCLVLLAGPFLHVLNLIPRGVLAGLL